MKNPKAEIRKLVYEMLSGIETPVYNAVLKSNKPPYVFIGQQTFVETSLKDTNMGIHTILIDVVTTFTENFGGDKQANDISDEIGEILSTMADYSTDNFHVITANIDTDDMLYDTNGSERIVSQVTTIRNLIQQKTILQS